MKDKLAYRELLLEAIDKAYKNYRERTELRRTLYEQTEGNKPKSFKPNVLEGLIRDTLHSEIFGTFVVEVKTDFYGPIFRLTVAEGKETITINLHDLEYEHWKRKK